MESAPLKPKCTETIKYPKHAVQVLERMHEFAKASKFSNISITLEKKSLSTNSLLLAACSQYYELALDSSNLQKIQENFEKCSKDVNHVVMEHLLKYFYTGELELDEDTIDDTLSVVSMLLLSEVFEDCMKFLERCLRPDNCLIVKKLAKKYVNDNLHKRSLSYALEHFEDVKNQEQFFEIDVEELTEFLRSDDLNVTSEKMVFESLKSWILHDRDNRLKHLSKLLNLVKLPLLPASYLFDVVVPFVHSESNCNTLLHEAMKWHSLPERRSELRCERTNPRKRTEVLIIVGNWELAQARMIDYYDRKTNVWSRYMDLSTCVNKMRFAAYIINNEVLIFGGDLGRDSFNTVELVNLNTKSMVHLSPLNDPRSAPATVELDGFVYAIGGLRNGKSLNSVERFDVKSRSWSRVAPMTTSRMGCGAVVLDGKIFVVGGGNESGVLDSTELYDPKKDKWEPSIPMNEKRKWVSVVKLNNFVYALGGDNLKIPAGGRLQTAERFDSKTNKWENIPNLVQAFDGAGVCVLNDKIIAVGGYYKKMIRNVQEYDPEKKSWQSLAPTTFDRGHVRASAISRDVLNI